MMAKNGLILLTLQATGQHPPPLISCFSFIILLGKGDELVFLMGFFYSLVLFLNFEIESLKDGECCGRGLGCSFSLLLQNFEFCLE